MRTAREDAGLSQQALADMVGVDAPTISRVEQGKRTLSLARAAQIAEVLHMPLLAQRPMPDAFKHLWTGIVEARRGLKDAELRGKAEVEARQAELLARIGELQALTGLAGTLTPPDDAARAVIRGADAPEQP